jgi:hypothetical protein
VNDLKTVSLAKRPRIGRAVPAGEQMTDKELQLVYLQSN